VVLDWMKAARDPFDYETVRKKRSALKG